MADLDAPTSPLYAPPTVESPRRRSSLDADAAPATPAAGAAGSGRAKTISWTFHFIHQFLLKKTNKFFEFLKETLTIAPQKTTVLYYPAKIATLFTMEFVILLIFQEKIPDQEDNDPTGPYSDMLILFRTYEIALQFVIKLFLHLLVKEIALRHNWARQCYASNERRSFLWFRGTWSGCIHWIIYRLLLLSFYRLSGAR